MTAGRPAVVVDTNVFGAELTRRGSAVADAYRSHVEGQELFISFVTMAELRYGARLAGWGEHCLRRLETKFDRSRGRVGERPSATGTRRSPARRSGRDHREQRVQALHPGVAAQGALLCVAIGAADGVIDVQAGQLVGPR